MPPGPYDMSAMADDAMAVLDAAKVDSAHVFGASMGGMIAQEVVLRHPQRVRSLILGCTACGGRDVVPAAREIREALNTRGTMTREESTRKMVPHTFDAGTPRERIDEDIAVRLAANVPNDGYFAQLDAIRAWTGRCRACTPSRRRRSSSTAKPMRSCRRKTDASSRGRFPARSS